MQSQTSMCMSCICLYFFSWVRPTVRLWKSCQDLVGSFIPETTPKAASAKLCNLSCFCCHVVVSSSLTSPSYTLMPRSSTCSQHYDKEILPWWPVVPLLLWMLREASWWAGGETSLKRRGEMELSVSVDGAYLLSEFISLSLPGWMQLVDYWFFCSTV